MHITFYRIYDNPKKLVKNLDTVIGQAKSLTPTQSVSVLKPTIICNYNASLLSANYCYIDTFDRYYFCTLELDTANRLNVYCEIDPLMSWQAQIKNCYVTVTRAENPKSESRYIPDKQLPIQPNVYHLHSQEFSSQPLHQESSLAPNENFSYLLIVDGHRAAI